MHDALERMRKSCTVITFGIAIVLLWLTPCGARPHLHVVEYGSREDKIGAILATGLDARNTPGAVTVTSDGAVWFRETFTWHPRIARFGADGSFREFRDPYAGWQANPCEQFDLCDPIPYTSGFTPLVARGTNVLFGPMHTRDSHVFMMSPTGQIHRVSASGCIVAGPDIACSPTSKVPIRFAPTYRSFRSYPTASIVPNSAVLGPDGNIWFTDTEHSLLGKVTIDGRPRVFTQGLTRWNSGPQLIAVGPDGNLWFTERRDRIGRITPSGQITEFSVGIPQRASLGGISAGPDGAMWFTLYHGMVVGRISMSGRITLYHDLVYPSDGHDFDPVAMIARDSHGRLYFNEGQAGRIARLTISPS